MRDAISIAALLATALTLTATAAFGFSPLTATVKVSNGTLYDYVVIGEHAEATDGFDNAYDTISPGNLNATMGQPFISVTIPHPDWQEAARELRGDIRAPAKNQQWRLSIKSSLPKDTPLTVILQMEVSSLPHGVKLKVQDKNKEIDLMNGITILAAGPGETTTVLISAEQP